VEWLAAWAIDGPARKLALAGPLRDARAVDVFGAMVSAAKDANGVRQQDLGMSPIYFSGSGDDAALEQCFRAVAARKL